MYLNRIRALVTLQEAFQWAYPAEIVKRGKPACSRHDDDAVDIERLAGAVIASTASRSIRTKIRCSRCNFRAFSRTGVRFRVVLRTGKWCAIGEVRLQGAFNQVVAGSTAAKITEVGGPCRDRTYDHLIKSLTL